ncbi:hypothetical protein CGLAU_02660 [Corynebacterium glaucum]|uniref:Uncharacterized protein n=1 Tax=Corynebacterium glaucum TaxID=187491 RepID=A0A1Q2HUJ4_9CORY|nr:hypothetical protein [Corynebacterium glaucum]AQQ14517.1 hypothetical protein CGLAU_02660 [Corynebacterium glaucum]
MTRLKLATQVLIAVPAALAIASCSATDDTTAETSAATSAPETVTEAVTQEATVETVTQQPTTEVDTAAPPAGATTPAGDCTTPPTDPRQQYATGTAPGRMPAENHTDTNYWIEDIENHYDPCAPLSWITFRGSLGREDGPAGTGASISDGLALYVNGQPDGEMRLFTKVESIEMLDDGQVRLTWGERGGATAAGITDHYTVDLTAQSGTVQAVAGDTEKFAQLWSQPGYLLN